MTKTSKETQRNDLLRQARIERNWRQHDLAEQLGTTTVTVKRWERGSQLPSFYFRVKLCTLFGKSAQELGLDEEDTSAPRMEEEVSEDEQASRSLSDPEALWMVPYVRNPHFTGRDELLEQLARELSLEQLGDATTTRRVVLNQPQAIRGLGGIGKTQAAVEYAYRAREQDRYTHTFWINAASEEAILTSFQTLAERLPNFAEKDEKDQRKLLAAVVRWIEQCSQPWLLIVDNADDLALVQPSLPQQGRGSLLLTTRATAVGWLANALEVDQMGLMEGTQFLLHRTQRLRASEEESNEATNVVIALDGFPLALDQAGAYIEETGCSFGDYLQLYEQHRTTFLARRGKQATHYPNSVATTWSLSFEQIEQVHPAAAELLRLCAFLSPDHIPEELLTDGAAHWPPVLQEVVVDPLLFNEALEALLAFSLVKRRASEHLLSLHRLVQVVQLDLMDPELQLMWAERTVRAVNTLFPTDPKDEVETWPQCLRYLEQVQACDTLIQHYHLHLLEASELLERAGVYLREHASYSLAESLFQRALAIAQQQLGPEHPQVASPLNNLGNLYNQQGNYEQAQPVLQRAVQIREQALGPDHPLVANSLNNLGNLYSMQGRYEQAEPFYQRAVRIWEQALGPHHFEVAYPLISLGNLYKEQGNYEQAEPLYQRALHILEQALGPNHPQVANPLNNLATFYMARGKYVQAEPLLQRALHIWEQTLGLNHPQVAYPLNNLGNIYKKQGNYEQAEPFYQRALHIRERALGPNHPQMATLLNNLGEFYKEQGRYEQAEPLLQRAFHILERALSPNHPLVAYPLNNLGELYKEQGRYEQAEPLYQQAVHIREQAPGPNHLLLAESLHGLANLSREQGRYEQADVLYQRVLTLRQQALSSEHTEVAETLHDLARLRQMQQRNTEALSLYQQVLAIREQALGSHHPKTTETRQRLRALLQALGSIEEAAALETPLEQARQENGETNTPSDAIDTAG